MTAVLCASSIVKTVRTLFVFVSLIVFIPTQACAKPVPPPATSAPPVASTAESPSKPFLIGAFVGANLHDWGDLAGMGSDSITTIHAICKDLSEMGMNAVWVTGFAPWFAEEPLMGAWLDAGKARGLGVVIEGSGEPYCIPRLPADQAEEVLRKTREEIVPAWQQIARTYRNHPALLAYSPVEEIGDNIELGENHTVRALAEVGRGIAEVDTHHPTLTIHIASWYSVAVEEAKLRDKDGGFGAIVFDLYLFSHAIPEWADVMDANFTMTPEEIPSKYLDFLERFVALGEQEGGSERPLPTWIMAQSYGSNWIRKIDGVPVSKPNSRFPNAAEMRFQIWAAALAGARGIFFFQYHSTPQPSPENQAELEEWEEGFGIRRLDGAPTEMHRSLTDAIAGVRPHLDLMGRMTPAGPIESDGAILSRGFLDPTSGKRYLLSVNSDLVNTEGTLRPGEGVLREEN